MTNESKYVSCERCCTQEASPGHKLCVFCLGEIEEFKRRWEEKKGGNKMIPLRQGTILQCPQDNFRKKV